jgi:hypothetical protein
VALVVIGVLERSGRLLTFGEVLKPVQDWEDLFDLRTTQSTEKVFPVLHLSKVVTEAGCSGPIVVN